MLWFFSIFFSIEATVSGSIGLAAVGFLLGLIYKDVTLHVEITQHKTSCFYRRIKRIQHG